MSRKEKLLAEKKAKKETEEAAAGARDYEILAKVMAATAELVPPAPAPVPVAPKASRLIHDFSPGFSFHGLNSIT
jgi:hypothetical protein